MKIKNEENSLLDGSPRGNKKTTSFKSDLKKAITILKAAPNLNVLHQIRHVELKKEESKRDFFSMRVDAENRLVFEKHDNDSVSLISINTKNHEYGS